MICFFYLFFISVSITICNSFPHGVIVCVGGHHETWFGHGVGRPGECGQGMLYKCPKEHSVILPARQGPCIFDTSTVLNTSTI